MSEFAIALFVMLGIATLLVVGMLIGANIVASGKAGDGCSKPERRPYLLYTISTQMLSGDCEVRFTEIAELPDVETLESAIAHKETAAILRVRQQRINVHLRKGDVAYIAQLQGGRLPDGCTELPDGFSLKYWRIEIR